MRHVVFFSGGAGSWAAARRVVAEHGASATTLLFADTRMEDEDLHRFLLEAAADVGAELVCIADGRTPWDVFRDVRFLGNTRIDPCSRVLKRDIMRAWVEERYRPDEVTLYLGISWDEAHRYERARARWEPYDLRAPMCEPPYETAADVVRAMRDRGIEPPRLYAMGFPHNNCGGFCVKAGQAHFANLLRRMPERYRWHEAQEEALRAELGDVAIMRDRAGGETKPITMRAFRERLEAQPASFDLFEWGGCGCFSGV